MRRDEILVVQGRVVDVRWVATAGQAVVAMDVHAVWRVNPPEPAVALRDRLASDGLTLRASRSVALDLRVGQRIVALVEGRAGRWSLGAVDVEHEPPFRRGPRVAARITTGY